VLGYKERQGFRGLDEGSRDTGLGRPESLPSSASGYTSPAAAVSPNILRRAGRLFSR
jgi:hypothetical protein